MKRWTLVLAALAAMLVVDTAEAGRRCGGRHRRSRCCGSSCGSSCGYAAPAPCAGGACNVGYTAPGYPAYANWTNGYPGVGYTGYDQYTAFTGYAPGAFYYGR